MADIYPEYPVDITEYTYRTPLHLVRALDAPKYREGRDANYIVAKPFTVSYRIEHDFGRKLHFITVPEGMLTDLTSSPIHSVVAPTGPWLEAAVVHDYLYVAWEEMPRYRPTKQDRLFADDMLLAGCKAAGVGWFKRQAIYRAVRAFGWAPFNERDGRSFLTAEELQEVLDAKN